MAKAALIKHEALMHPKAKGRDGDKLKCTKCNTEQKASAANYNTLYSDKTLNININFI